MLNLFFILLSNQFMVVNNYISFTTINMTELFWFKAVGSVIFLNLMAFIFINSFKNIAIKYHSLIRYALLCVLVEVLVLGFWPKHESRTNFLNTLLVDVTNIKSLLQSDWVSIISSDVWNQYQVPILIGFLVLSLPFWLFILSIFLVYWYRNMMLNTKLAL